MRFISVTPIDEVDGAGKLIVHPPIMVNAMAIRKIEPVEVEKPMPIVAKATDDNREPMEEPPSSHSAPVAVPMLISKITLIDGKWLEVKEPIGNFNVLIA
jgi:hypothetical protein